MNPVLYKCLTSADGGVEGEEGDRKKNGEVNKEDRLKGWVSSKMDGGGLENSPIIEADQVRKQHRVGERARDWGKKVCNWRCLVFV